MNTNFVLWLLYDVTPYFILLGLGLAGIPVVDGYRILAKRIALDVLEVIAAYQKHELRHQAARARLLIDGIYYELPEEAQPHDETIQGPH